MTDRDECPLRKGDIIPRPVSMNAMTGMEILKVMPAITERGDRMFKAVAGGGFMTLDRDAFVVNANPPDRNPRGLTVFVRGDLPDDWTHLEVIGVAKRGNAVFATPGSNGTMWLLDQYGEERRDDQGENIW